MTTCKSPVHPPFLKATVVLCFLSLFAVNKASSQISSKKAKSDTAEMAEKRFLRYTIIHADQNGFGYNIFNKAAMVVHQPSTPGEPGNNGFYTKQDAVKVAKLAMFKISQNIFPPTITKKELDSLHIKR